MREASDVDLPDDGAGPARADTTLAPASAPGDRRTALTPATRRACAPTELDGATHPEDSGRTTLPTASAGAVGSPRPGQSIRGYRLEELLGRGGMGEVWLARDETLRRPVALKLMATRSSSGWSRFAREARALAALDHPHIARLYEFGDDPPFLAMQFVRGQPLDAARGDRIAALRDIARAVHHAHVRGVLHRDLKPANLIVDDDGAAYVLDFGLAHLAAEDSDLTVSGQILGTPAFMAPEQARGEVHAIDARTDVYGLGATLYALLAGRAPFTGERLAVVRRVVEDDPEPPPGHPDLVAIALTAMAKDPARRYATAAAFADDLDRHLGREPVRARRPNLAHRLRRAIERRPLPWALGGALALAIVAGGAFGVAQMRRAMTAQRAEAAAERAEREHLDRALAAERARSRSEAARAAELDLAAFIDRQQRRLDDLDDALAVTMDDAGLARAYDELAAIDGECAAHPGVDDHGVLARLRGRSLLLRSREDEAIARFDAAVRAGQAAGAAAPSALPLARLARAHARLRRDYQDLMARLFALDDEACYRDAANRDALLADIAAVGDHGAAYDRGILDLWSGYIDAFSTDMNKYFAVHDKARAIADAGGRRCEDAWLIAGIVSPPPQRDALRCYTASLDRYHAQPRVLALRAVERLYSGGDAAAVIADLDEALRLKPDYALAYAVRAQASRGLHDPARAAGERADLDAAIARDPRQAVPLAGRALRRFLDGDAAGARADLDAADAVATPRSRPRALEMRAVLEREAGLADNAIAHATSAGGSPSAQLALIAARVDRGDAAAAKALLAQLDAYAGAGGELGAALHLARVRIASLARDAAAATAAAQAVARCGVTPARTQAAADAQAAMWLTDAGAPDAALAAADAALANDAAEAQALAARAIALASLARGSEAATARAAAVAALPAWTTTRLAEGDLADGERGARVIAAFAPDDAAAAAAVAALAQARERAKAAFAAP